MTAPDPAATGLGREPIDPHALILWRVSSLGPVALLGALAVAVAAVRGISALVGVAIGGTILTAGIVWLVTGAAWRSWQFEVGDDALVVRHGVVVRVESTIPYHRVQHVDLEAGPLERLAGITRMVLRTASASSDSAVPGIPAVRADALRSIVLARIGQGDSV